MTSFALHVILPGRSEPSYFKQLFKARKKVTSFLQVNTLYANRK